MDKLFQALHIDLNKSEFNKFGILASAILVQDAFAAVAILCALLYDKSFIGIVLVATAANIANAMGIAQQPVKWVIMSSIVSVIVSILLYIYCFI